jgi:hypothetical protein
MKVKENISRDSETFGTFMDLNQFNIVLISLSDGHLFSVEIYITKGVIKNLLLSNETYLKYRIIK